MGQVKLGGGLAMAVALALAGCKPGGGVPGSSSAEADSGKFNAYVTAYNALTQSSLGLEDQYVKYVELRIPRESPSDNIVIQPDWVGDKLEALKKARALPGSSPGLDAAGDKMITTLSGVITRFEGLKTYYESKKYADDGLARGKREDPLMVADFKAALAAADDLSQAIAVAHDAQSARDLARLKSSGDMIGYDEVLAIQKARTLVHLFKTPADLTSPDRYKQGDALVTDLEALVADERAQLAKAGRRELHDRNSYFSDSLANLDKLIGEYRDLKRTRDSDHADGMVREFNYAIGSMNSAD